MLLQSWNLIERVEKRIAIQRRQKPDYVSLTRSLISCRRSIFRWDAYQVLKNLNQAIRMPFDVGCKLIFNCG